MPWGRPKRWIPLPVGAAFSTAHAPSCARPPAGSGAAQAPGEAAAAVALHRRPAGCAGIRRASCLHGCCQPAHAPSPACCLQHHALARFQSSSPPAGLCPGPALQKRQRSARKSQTSNMNGSWPRSGRQVGGTARPAAACLHGWQRAAGRPTAERRQDEGQPRSGRLHACLHCLGALRLLAASLPARRHDAAAGARPQRPALRPAFCPTHPAGANGLPLPLCSQRTTCLATRRSL